MCLKLRCATPQELGPALGKNKIGAGNPTTPSAYKSLRQSRKSPAACSGLMKWTVPSTFPVIVSFCWLPSRAIPKSVTSARPEPRSMTYDHDDQPGGAALTVVNRTSIGITPGSPPC